MDGLTISNASRFIENAGTSATSTNKLTDGNAQISKSSEGQKSFADTLKEEYREDTPVAVVYKASWEDQKIVIGNLTNIAQKVKEAGITKTALTVVGDFLGDEYELSKLYDKTFTHEFRQAKE